VFHSFAIQVLEVLIHLQSVIDYLLQQWSSKLLKSLCFLKIQVISNAPHHFLKPSAA